MAAESDEYVPPPAGNFCFVEFVSEAPEKLVEYFAKVFPRWGKPEAWKEAAWGDGHWFITLTGPTSALVRKPKEARHEVPGQVLHIVVDSVAATSAAIEEAGGELVGGTIPAGEGSYAYFRSPGGVLSAIVQHSSGGGGGAKKRPAAECTVGHAPYEVQFGEFVVKQGTLASSCAFYKAVFGWQLIDLGGGVFIVNTGNGAGGYKGAPTGALIREVRSDSGELVPNSIAYVNTEGLEGVQAAGKDKATVLVEKMEAPTGSWSYVKVGDCVLSLWESKLGAGVGTKKAKTGAEDSVMDGAE